MVISNLLASYVLLYPSVMVINWNVDMQGNTLDYDCVHSKRTCTVLSAAKNTTFPSADLLRQKLAGLVFTRI